jgi:outer membrane protein
MLKALSRPAALALAAALSLVTLASRAPAQTTPLTLERALSEVETVNLSVLSNREFIGQAQESAVRTRSALLPAVSGRADQTRARRSTGTSNSFSAAVGASMTIFDLQQYRTLQAARKAIEVSRLDFEGVVQGVLASIATLYFEHVRDRAFDRVIESNIERAEVLLNLARNQLRAGVATQIDVTRAEAELVTQQQAKLRQETVVVNSGLRIKVLLNLDLGAELALEDFRVRRELDLSVQNVPLDDVLEKRAEYRAALAALDQARLSRRAADAGRMPTIGVDGSVGISSETPLDDDDEYSWSAGIGLNLPIWEGNRIRADQRIAASRERQQEYELADLRNQIGAELRNSVYSVMSQIAQIEVAEKNLVLAEEELRLARVRYEQGVADNRELIDAENRYTTASFNLVDALFSYHAARVELARVRGDVRLILAEKLP